MRRAQQAPPPDNHSRGAMLAASALLANAVVTPTGETGVAPAAGDADAFTSALAALTTALGQPQPARTAAAGPAAAASFAVAAGGAAPSVFQPGSLQSAGLP